VIVAIAGAIPQKEASALRDAISSGPFVTDTSSPFATRSTLDPTSREAARAVAALTTLLRDQAAFQNATFPAAISTPAFHRHQRGMGEHDHVDEPIVGQALRLRTDIVVTVCLSDGYEGGELVVDHSGIVERWKGGPGDCLLFPAGARQRIEPVTGGERLAATFWVQSYVRDPAHRKILSDLGKVLQHFERTKDVKPHAELLRHAYTNLLREWTEGRSTSTAATG
jgi:PKHD-type hydroxylase